MAFLAAVLLATALEGSPQEAAFLVVFVDGGFLQARGVELVAGDRLRLALPEGASLEVPLVRVERILEVHQEVAEEAAKPLPSAAVCSPAFVPEPLPSGTPYAAELLAAGAKHDLHPRLLAAVVQVESGFNPWAVSRVGARGLMQLMPAVWLAYGLLEPHDPQRNLMAGAAHLRKLLDRFGRLELALAAYNAGAAVVEAYGGIPPYRETQGFVQAVLGRFCPPPGSL
jgi:soluble lytic murein transglycosylase-like protein